MINSYITEPKDIEFLLSLHSVISEFPVTLDMSEIFAFLIVLKVFLL